MYGTRLSKMGISQCIVDNLTTSYEVRSQLRIAKHKKKLAEHRIKIARIENNTDTINKQQQIIDQCNQVIEDSYKWIYS